MIAVKLVPSRFRQMPLTGRARIAWFAGIKLALLCVALPAVAQSHPSEAQIRDALKPADKPALTRSLTRSVGAPAPRPAMSAEQSALVRSLAAKPTRAISIEERKTIVEIAQTRPQIDLTITFDYDSAQVTPQSMPAIAALGRALASADFAGNVFLINGHTDGRGSADYNQDLSQRRAESVKRLLITQFGIPPQNLVAMGFGFSHLKNDRDPFAAENRRVQVVNTEVK